MSIHRNRAEESWITGEKIALRPLRLDEAVLMYKWATNSDAAPFWYGDLYGNQPPTYQQFKASWKNYYFDGSKPRYGRCFAILLNNHPIGQVNYNRINPQTNKVEIDIIIAADRHKNKGYGSDALVALTNYLFDEFNVAACWIEAITKNPRALRAYQKAGFQLIKTYSKNNRLWQRLEITQSPKQPGRI